MDPWKRQQRREQFARLDAWLLRLHREHPVRALALTFGVALVLGGLSWLLKVLVMWAAHWAAR